MKIQDDTLYCHLCFFFSQKLTDVVEAAGRDTIPIKCPVCREEENYIDGAALKKLILVLWVFTDEIVYHHNRTGEFSVGHKK